MAVYRSPVERSRFIVVREGEYGLFTLFSEKYGRSFDIHLNILRDLEMPQPGDIFELPDAMLYMDDGFPIFSNRELSFGFPEKDPSGPDGFNIEEDLAYLTCMKDKKRLLIQRYYG